MALPDVLLITKKNVFYERVQTFKSVWKIKISVKIITKLHFYKLTTYLIVINLI